MLAYSFDEPASLNPLLGGFREVNETLAHVAHDILRFTTVSVLTVLAGSPASYRIGRLGRSRTSEVGADRGDDAGEL